MLDEQQILENKVIIGSTYSSDSDKIEAIKNLVDHYIEQTDTQILNLLIKASSFADFSNARSDLITYRTQLKDITNQPGYPSSVSLPTDPTDSENIPSTAGLVREIYSGVYHNDSDGFVGSPTLTSNVSDVTFSSSSIETHVFTGFFKAPATDTYTFSLRSDDGSWMTVRGEVVSEHYGMHTIDGGTPVDTPVYLLEGSYSYVRIIIGNSTNTGTMTLQVSSTSTGTVTDLSPYWFRK